MSCGPEDCRYGLFDFEYQHQCQGTSEKTMKEKLLLMSWCPDTARIKKKMLYSSSFDALKKCLVGVQKYIQVSQIIQISKKSQNVTKGKKFVKFVDILAKHCRSHFNLTNFLSKEF